MINRQEIENKIKENLEFINLLQEQNKMLTEELNKPVQISNHEFVQKRASKDGSYAHFYANFEADTHVENDSIMNNNHYFSFNYFDTKTEAKLYADWLQNALEILRVMNTINGDWKPNFKNGKNYVVCLSEDNLFEGYFFCYNYILAFENASKRQEFRNKISDEKIKMFLKGI